jgi:hypothetical protein
MALDITNAPGLLPHQKQVALASNYLSFNGGSGTGDSDTFAQQYLPELYEAEVERFGNRTLQGFLRMVGAEMPMSSDQVIWSEQNRLHISYDECTNNGAGTILTVPIDGDTKECVIRIGATVVISNGLDTVKARVHDVDAATGTGASRVANVHYKTYKVNDGSSLGTTSKACKIFVYGSEFGKGTNGMETFQTGGADVTAIQPDFTQFSNKPIILKDFYEVSGSDASQIGWVEVATEDGTSGYLWYLKAESETRLRFEDYLEMSMVEAEKAGSTTSGISVDGSEGLFAAIEARGNIYNDFAGAAQAGSGALGDFDAILKQLDTQGAIEENMLFLSRQTALDFDDMIATMNGGFAGSAAGRGASYGLFNNEESMALNFGFDGFRRGSYDFYKTDWKYLNDASTRGLTADVDGVLIPAGTSTVYDQIMGQNIRRSFLHVRYRASEADDRRMKSWVVGSVGGAYTSGLDAMQVHFLSERCLCVQGANNFVLFKSTV